MVSILMLRVQTRLLRRETSFKTLPNVIRRFYFSSFQNNSCNEIGTDLHLSKGEAISFVEDILKIQSPLTLRKRDPLQLLDKIPRKIKLEVPYTNFVYARRHGMTILPVQEIKRLMFTRQGGACLIISSFTKDLLQHLGYEARLVEADLPRKLSGAQAEGGPPRVTASHVGLVVHDLSFQGSMHLVELGTRHPILQPIPLDFAHVSPEYHLGYYSIKFLNYGSGVVKMFRPAADDTSIMGTTKSCGGPKTPHMSIKGTDTSTEATVSSERQKTSNTDITGITTSFEGRKWDHLMTYRILQPRSFDFCQEETNKILRDRTIMPRMMDNLVLFGFSGCILTSIVGNTFFQYGRVDQLEMRKIMKTNTEIIDTMNKHFPQYPSEQVADELMFWNPEK